MYLENISEVVFLMLMEIKAFVIFFLGSSYGNPVVFSKRVFMAFIILKWQIDFKVYLQNGQVVNSILTFVLTFIKAFSCIFQGRTLVLFCLNQWKIPGLGIYAQFPYGFYHLYKFYLIILHRWRYSKLLMMNKKVSMIGTTLTVVRFRLRVVWHIFFALAFIRGPDDMILLSSRIGWVIYPGFDLLDTKEAPIVHSIM